MIYQNNESVEPPSPFLRALERDDYTKGKSDFSVTELISPPQRTWLAQNHEKEQETLYSRYASMMGTAMHNVLENNVREDLGELAEERFYMEMQGAVVSGQIDHYEHKTIYDYKYTGGEQQEAKPEHYKQAQMNGLLTEVNGHEVLNCSIQYIQRDWSFMRAKFSKDAPQTPFKQFSFTYKKEEAIQLFSTTIKDHQDAKGGNPRPCTDEERWKSPTKYACIRPEGKRASKVCNTKEEAEENLKKGQIIEERPGEATYCNYFCGFAHVCPQHKGDK